jgi:hypothetical protein
MNYPVAIGDAKLAEQYSGVLGLPVSFLIGRDGRIYVKHLGETDISLIEREIKWLLWNELTLKWNSSIVARQGAAAGGGDASADLRDPILEEFATTGSMSVGRDSQTSGKMLGKGRARVPVIEQCGGLKSTPSAAQQLWSC